MSNWMYANQVPTETWRNAMTLPRELKLRHVGKAIFVSAQAVAELSSIQSKLVEVQNISVNKIIDIGKLTGKVGLPCMLDISADQLNDFSIVLSNSIGEELQVGYVSKLQQYFIDRSKSGKSDFNKDFAKRHVAPRLADEQRMKFSLVIDASSIELFADDGLTVMTAVFFPNKPYDKMQIKSPDNLQIKKLLYSKLKSIWK